MGGINLNEYDESARCAWETDSGYCKSLPDRPHAVVWSHRYTGIATTMKIGRRDLRNLAVVVGVMSMMLTVVAEGTLAVRLVVGVIGGLFSGLVFLVVTAVIYVFC